MMRRMLLLSLQMLQLLILITSEVGVLVRSVKVLVSKAISAPRIYRGIVAQFTAGG